MSEESVPVILFTIGEQHYAIPVAIIQEVAALVKFTPLPDAPPQILGAVNRHGSIIPLLDLRLCLGKPVEENTLDLTTQFLVVMVGEVMAGLVVDDVQGIRMLPQNVLHASTNSGPYVQGMAVLENQPVFVFDTIALLQQFAPAQSEAPIRNLLE